MNTENCIVKKVEVIKINNVCFKTILSRLFFQKYLVLSKEQSKIRKHKKRTIEVNPPIAIRNGYPSTAHSKASIEDLFVFEYEYELTPHILKKNSRIGLN